MMQTKSSGLWFSVAVHGAIVIALFASLVWLIPAFLSTYCDFVGGFPQPFEQAIDVTTLAREYGLFFLVALPGLLWLDLRFSRSLLCRRGTRAAAWWSALVLAALGAFTIWLVWALSYPGIMLYLLHGH